MTRCATIAPRLTPTTPSRWGSTPGLRRQPSGHGADIAGALGEGLEGICNRVARKVQGRQFRPDAPVAVVGQADDGAGDPLTRQTLGIAAHHVVPLVTADRRIMTTRGRASCRPRREVAHPDSVQHGVPRRQGTGQRDLARRRQNLGLKGARPKSATEQDEQKSVTRHMGQERRHFIRRVASSSSSVVAGRVSSVGMRSGIGSLRPGSATRFAPG